MDQLGGLAKKSKIERGSIMFQLIALETDFEIQQVSELFGLRVSQCLAQERKMLFGLL